MNSIKLVLVIFFLLAVESCSEDDHTPYPPTSSSMAKIFNSRYDLNVSQVPIVYVDSKEHYVSVLYMNGKRYRVYLSERGGVRSEVIDPLFPKGVLKVLCLIRLHPDLNIDQTTFREEWEAAQEAINNQHKLFSQAMGLQNPIVSFENHNYYLTKGEIAPSYTDTQFLDIYASVSDLNLEDFDIHLLMDLDLDNPKGGIGIWQERFARVGWLYDDNEMNDFRYSGLAYAAYHHEIGHIWGWEHNWSDPLVNHGFITNPSLFGWTDIDNDGTPEILDENPYK